MQSRSIPCDSPTPSPSAISAQSEAPTFPEGIGLSREDSPASHLVPPHADGITQPISGPKCGELWPSSDLDSLLLKTSTKRQFYALETIADHSVWGQKATEYRPPQWVQLITGSVFGWLPTPTAKANHTAPSMRKWPAYLAFQRWTRRKLTPELWEAMMGYPTGWTDLNASGIALSLRSPN